MAAPLPAQAPGGEAQVPCSVLRSAAHGVILLGARVQSSGGPPCALMDEYRDWLQRSDTLVLGRARRREGFTGREWDYASGAIRIGTPSFFVLIRGDSLSPARAGRPRRLHLTAFAAEDGSPIDTVGSWFVLVDEDSAAPRLFRPAFTARRPRRVLEERGTRVLALPGVRTVEAHIRAQLAAAQALRAALGFDDELPAAHIVLGPAGDSTLAMLGVVTKHRALYAMTVFPPLATFAPVTHDGGVDAHELVHLATFGRREVIPGAVAEAFAMHHGGSHGRPFAAAFCASRAFDGLPPLGPAALDSAMLGRWWHDARADVGGFALGHAMGWFLAARADSAWVFADGEPARDNDAVGFLARRAGIPRDSALQEVARTLDERRRACAPASPPAAAPPVRPPASP